VSAPPRARAPIDVASGRTRGLERGIPSAPAAAPDAQGRSPRISTGRGAAGRAERPSSMRGLENLRRENPAQAEQLRDGQLAVGRATDLAVRAGVSTTIGAVGGFAGFASGSSCGSDDFHGKTCYNWAVGLSLTWNSCWWGVSWCWPSFCFGYYPYYYNHCYWYGYPYYACAYPAYYPIYPVYYSSYPVYYESVPSTEYVVEEQPAAYPEGEAVAPASEPAQEPAAAETSSPERTEALARAASQYLKLGDRAFREGRYGDAAHFYAKAIEFAPEEGVLYLILSDALFATGDYHYAAFAVRKAAELDPALFETPVDKHSFYGDPAEFDRQLAVLELYLDDHYLDDDARLVLAANYLFGGRPAAVVDLLEHPFSEGLRGSPAGDLILKSARALQHG
jgi:hypothetical protein